MLDHLSVLLWATGWSGWKGPKCFKKHIIDIYHTQRVLKQEDMIFIHESLKITTQHTFFSVPWQRTKLISTSSSYFKYYWLPPESQWCKYIYLTIKTPTHLPVYGDMIAINFEIPQNERYIVLCSTCSLCQM